MDKYKPSNGTEGDCFMSKFCFQCTKWNGHDDADGEPCSILGDALVYDVTDKGYPKEWIRDEKGARCTAFVPEGDEIPYRCENTKDMF